MAETPLKRQRDETQLEDGEETKRHKSYNHIISLLEVEEDEPAEDLSSLMTKDCAITSSSPSSASSCSKEDEANDRERVMRHLLEASDDELGIPSMEVRVNSTEYGDVGVNSGDELALCDGLWDLEDEAANYYTLLQSELFM
ncbi:Zinc finger CCHC domain protein [Melia azedarach]|uniref:Zinc finger CCHC domain protein n=1 Tax=Melia azedarach TaxID=155640 RepID=A0ACC1XK58_MELAZ|nr:Zinc finger CCHC domain protein [Melia azedarach]